MHRSAPICVQMRQTHASAFTCGERHAKNDLLSHVNFARYLVRVFVRRATIAMHLQFAAANATKIVTWFARVFASDFASCFVCFALDRA